MPIWNNDPLITTLRAGTISDPFLNLIESFTIPSIQKILLTELPDPVNKLIIDGFTEVFINTPLEDHFYCNYYTGQVYFNSANIGDNISISYYGRGLISIPISKIYTSLDSNGNIIENLQEMIDRYNLYTEDIRIANELLRIEHENSRISLENARIVAETNRINAENIRVAGGALIKSGGTMTGDISMAPDKGIVFGNFKIKNNVSLGTIDIELI